MTREKILEYIRDYFDETENIPSVRAIAKNVEGVNRGNFYDFFASTDELAVALGIDVEESPRKPVEALEARRAKGEKSYRLTLTEIQSQRFAALAFMENRDVSMVIDDVLDRERQVREVMDQVEGGVLDSEAIDAVLHSEFVFDGVNVAEFAGKPWLVLPCSRCGDDLYYGAGINSNEWYFTLLPLIKKTIKVTCADCVSERGKFIRIPA